MREFGYLDQKNIIIESRFAEGMMDRFSDLVVELVRLKVDIILTESTPAAQAAKKATETIPIVMAASGDPISAGLVQSLARPGRNITGLTFRSSVSKETVRLPPDYLVLSSLTTMLPIW